MTEDDRNGIIEIPDGPFADILEWIMELILGSEDTKDIEKEYVLKSNEKVGSSEDDLKAGRWSNAVENMVSAVELSTKAYCLRSGFIPKDHEWTHETPRFFLDVMNKKGVQRLAELQGVEGKVVEFAKLLENDNDELLNLPKKDIDFLLEAVVKIKESIIGQMKEVFENKSDLIFDAYILYILSTITFKHVKPSRFPQNTLDLEKSRKPSDYKPGVPIVDSVTQILSLVKVCNEDLVRALEGKHDH